MMTYFNQIKCTELVWGDSFSTVASLLTTNHASREKLVYVTSLFTPHASKE